MFQFKNVKCKKLYASGNRVRLVSMATCSLLFTRSHALCRFNSLVYVYFSLLIRLVAEIVDFFNRSDIFRIECLTGSIH